MTISITTRTINFNLPLSSSVDRTWNLQKAASVTASGWVSLANSLRMNTKCIMSRIHIILLLEMSLSSSISNWHFPIKCSTSQELCARFEPTVFYYGHMRVAFNHIQQDCFTGVAPGNLMITSVQWCSRNVDITTTKQSAPKPYAYFMGYTITRMAKAIASTSIRHRSDAKSISIQSTFAVCEDQSGRLMVPPSVCSWSTHICPAPYSTLPQPYRSGSPGSARHNAPPPTWTI